MQTNERANLKTVHKMEEALTTPSTSATSSTRVGKFTPLSARNRNSKSARSPWLSRRHTPYVKTPKTGRASRSHPDGDGGLTENLRSKTASTEIERRTSTLKDSSGSPNLLPSNAHVVEQIRDPVREIVGKTLRVHQASPLHNFDQENKSSLETYGNQLSAFLQLETEKQLLVDEDGNVEERKFKVQFSVHKDISAEGSKFSAVKIIVCSTDSLRLQPVGEVEPLVPILTTLFCSVGSEEEEDARLQEHFTCLPICLINGPVNISKNLISWCQSQFDCRITPMTFSSVELGWYFSLWAGMSSPERSPTIELCYDASSVAGLRRILYSIEGKDAKQLWDIIHMSDSSIFTEEESVMFLEALKKHFYHHFRINLEGLPLTRVRTAVAFIACEGKLKIVHPRFTDHILEQLTRTALTKEFYGRLR